MENISSKLGIYLRGSGTDLLATVISKGAGFGSVWMLNQVLEKGAYGNYELAFTVVALLMLAGSGGFNHAVMYRLSRLDAPPEKLDGHDFAGAVLGWSLIVSSLFAGLVFAGAPYIEAIAGNENLAFWVSLLSFLIPIRVARGVYQSWYKARQCIPEALLMGKILPATGKMAFLGGVWVVWSTPQGVVVAILLSELVPLLIWYGRMPVNPFNLWGRLTSWDIWYSLKLAFTRGLSKTQKNTDVLMIGFLATARNTAEYVVAAKIALLLITGHKILNTTLRPRIGRYLGQGNRLAVLKEYDQSRSAALLIALAGTSLLILIGKTILGIFGQYESSYSVLVVLAASHVISVSFGMSGGYLNISGYAGWTLFSTIILLIINVCLNYILIPVYGPIGAAISTLVSYTLSNSINAMLIYFLDEIKVYDMYTSFVVILSVSICLLVLCKLIIPFLATMVMLTLVLAYLYVKRNLFSGLLGNMMDLINIKSA